MPTNISQSHRCELPPGEGCRPDAEPHPVEFQLRVAHPDEVGQRSTPAATPLSVSVIIPGPPQIIPSLADVTGETQKRRRASDGWNISGPYSGSNG
jgi:hypothetical protein